MNKENEYFDKDENKNELENDAKKRQDIERSYVAAEQSVTESYEIHPDVIETNHIDSPLVIFYGPREIGKTVALLRLSKYIGRKYMVDLDEGYRNDMAYEKIVIQFKSIMNNFQFAPEATGAINFLVLNVVEKNGSPFCKILEAPGEHYFDPLNPEKQYPPYLLRIFYSNVRKIFVFFFTIEMFNDDRLYSAYSKRIEDLVKKQIDPKKDRIIILCNKVDMTQHIINGRPKKYHLKNMIYHHPENKGLIEAIKTSRQKSVYFIPFSSGVFVEADVNGQQKKVFVHSNDRYPKKLWDAIFKCVRGGIF